MRLWGFSYYETMNHSLLLPQKGKGAKKRQESFNSTVELRRHRKPPVGVEPTTLYLQYTMNS